MQSKKLKLKFIALNFSYTYKQLLKNNFSCQHIYYRSRNIREPCYLP